MSIDENTLVIVGVLVTTLIAEMRMLRRYIAALVPAVMERDRRRELRRRRESVQPPSRRRELQSSDDFDEEANTDIHYLIDIEREHQRTRRKTDRQRRPGERPPRPGTHHD